MTYVALRTYSPGSEGEFCFLWEREDEMNASWFVCDVVALKFSPSILALLPGAAPSLTTSFSGQWAADGASGWQIVAKPADWLSNDFLANWLSFQLIN